jgi:hypothetical protein
VDKLPQVAAHRVTHVVSLSAVTIIAVTALAFADAPPLVYLLVTAVLLGTIGALVQFPQLSLERQHLLDYLMASQFRRFRPELTQGAEPKAITEADRSLEERREQEYIANRGCSWGITGGLLSRRARRRTYEYSCAITRIPMAAQPRWMRVRSSASRTNWGRGFPTMRSSSTIAARSSP